MQQENVNQSQTQSLLSYVQVLRTCYAQTSAEQEQIYGIDVPAVQLAVYAKSSTLYIWSHGRKSKFFWLDGLLTISYNYGAMLRTLRVPLQAYRLHACKCAPLLGTGLRRNSRLSDQDSIKQ